MRLTRLPTADFIALADAALAAADPATATPGDLLRLRGYAHAADDLARSAARTVHVEQAGLAWLRQLAGPNQPTPAQDPPPDPATPNPAAPAAEMEPCQNLPTDTAQAAP